MSAMSEGLEDKSALAPAAASVVEDNNALGPEAPTDAMVVALALRGSAPSEEQLASLTATEREKYEYLKAQVMPTLSRSLQALLREREARQSQPGSAPPLELVQLNPLGFVAQHLMRNNPNLEAATRAH